MSNFSKFARAANPTQQPKLRSGSSNAPVPQTPPNYLGWGPASPIYFGKKARQKLFARGEGGFCCVIYFESIFLIAFLAVSLHEELKNTI
jgi:hypothetical protein